jgi:hypothetical protein
MARTEARIFVTIWRDEDFIALPPGPQRLYMFLLSQHDLSHCGVLPLIPQRWASKAAGMGVADIERDLKALEGSAYPSANPDPARAKTPFVIVDQDTGEVFVRSLLRRDGIWKQPNVLKQARDSADQIESRMIRGALLAELHRLPLDESGSDLVRRVVEEFITDLEKDGPYPSAYPSPIPSDDLPDEGNGDPSGIGSADPAQGIGEGYGSSGGVSPDPLFPVPRSPDSLPAQPAKPDRKLGTRLPDDFAVTPEMVEWFREHCPHVDGKHETERFVDYWHGKPGKDGRKLDWAATWRNWMRTAEERAKPRERSSPSLPVSAADQRRADVARLRELDRQQREGHLPAAIQGEVIQ